MVSKKIIYYYQTLISLDPLINSGLSTNNDVYIYISSLHFGYKNDQPQIYLNDLIPEKQPTVWKDLKKAQSKGYKILVLLGGAGGAYQDLFNDYNTFYNLLIKFLKKYNFIEGIDLDVEEKVDIKDIIRLIKDLRRDFGKDFIITMAPIAGAMIKDDPGLGGYIYKELYKSNVGSLISWFNVQCYGCYNFDTYNKIINNGYPSDKIVFGMLGDDYNPLTFPQALNEIKNVYIKYPQMGGCILWEYGDTKINPITWGSKISNIYNMKNFKFLN